jgi:hypothetical protein
VLGACSDSVTSKIAAPKDLTPRFGIVGDQAHIVQVCVDPSSSPGTYQFAVAKTTVGQWPYPTFELQFSADADLAGVVENSLGPFSSGGDNDVVPSSPVSLTRGASLVCANVFTRATTLNDAGNRLWTFGGQIWNPAASVLIHPILGAGVTYTVSCHNDDPKLPQDTATLKANAASQQSPPAPPVCTNGADGTINMYSSANVYHGSTLTYTFTGPPVTPCPAGSFSWSIANAAVVPGYPDGAVGDILVRYDQFPAPNDNSYGVNAVGWPNGHTFGNLTGSDKAGIQILLNGVVKLSFNMDYLTAFAGAPSGYKSLGVTGGDGSMLLGSSTGINVTTSLANNLNNINIPGLFNPGTHAQLIMGASNTNVLVNSPPTDPAHTTYTISDAAFANWDFHDTYYARISQASNPSLVAAGGFPLDSTAAANAGWTVVPNLTVLHNSPAKPCPGGAGQCNVAVTKTETKDKQVKITIKNNATTDTFLTGLDLTWLQATNGNLTQIKLDNDVIWNGPAIGSPAGLTLANLVADQNKRKIGKNSSDVLTLIFAKNVSSTLSNYTGTAHFGDDCELTILP